MNVVETPQSVCRAGFARADITPPVGIYHRMWGAAAHDRATGVHRPLTAAALWVEPTPGETGEPQLLLALDHCIIDREEIDRFRERAAAAGISPEQVLVTLSHTHGACWMSRSRSHLPGGDLIGPYLDRLADTCARLAGEAAAAAKPAVITYGVARCSLARHRDYPDHATHQVVCGFNPVGPSDDTVLVARVTELGPKPADPVCVVVNYACHPTTLAWENTLISPDYVGALRVAVEDQAHAPCLFLQGASGDLGPQNGYVGDVRQADANGWQLGYAALSGLMALPPPGTRFEYTGPVVSGAILGTWAHRPLDAAALSRNANWAVRRVTVDLPYRVDLPDLDATRRELARWEAEETAARAAGDDGRARDARARAEQMTRQIARLTALVPGRTYPFRVTLWKLGGAVWVFAQGELYQHFQITLRQRFPHLAVVVVTLTGDWQPGYLPTVGSYGLGIYQEVIAALAPGSLEVLTETVCREIERL